jgi:hypothetical protein
MSSLPKHNVTVVTTAALFAEQTNNILYGILMSAGAAKAIATIYPTDDGTGDPVLIIQTAAAGKSVFLDFEKMGGIRLANGGYCDLTAETTAQVTIWYD